MYDTAFFNLSLYYLFLVFFSWFFFLMETNQWETIKKKNTEKGVVRFHYFCKYILVRKLGTSRSSLFRSEKSEWNVFQNKTSLIMWENWTRIIVISKRWKWIFFNMICKTFFAVNNTDKFDFPTSGLTFSFHYDFLIMRIYLYFSLIFFRFIFP